MSPRRKTPRTSRSILLYGFLLLGLIWLIYYGDKSKSFLSCQGTHDSTGGWSYPDWNTVPNDLSGILIRYGKELVARTSKYIGPSVADTNMRFAGNELACTNCHLDNGTRRYGLGLVGVYSAYPQFSPRLDTIESIESRVNDCMQRSMNGKPLPPAGTEMKGFVAYLKWLSSYIPRGSDVGGRGLSYMPLLPRAADTSHGRVVYANKCMTCHAYDGSGTLNNPFNPSEGFNTPAVWGDNSYNDAAGIYMLITGANFIKTKMPYKNPDLSDQDAYDVSAYINSMPHPHFVNLSGDYPDLNYKPIDFPFPPFIDNLTAEQHRYGPYNTNAK